MSDSGASHIETLEIQQGSSQEIQMVITFHTKVRFRRIINSNGHNFSHGGPILVHNILRLPKLNNGSSREIQMVITINSGIRFGRITYRDA